MERLWTKPFILMTAGMLFLFTGFYLLLPTLPLYIKQLGASESQVGLAAGAFTLAAVATRPLVGGLLDRYGRRVFMIAGLLLFTLSMYAYDWVGGLAMLFALRVLHGVSWAFSTTAVGTSITDIIPSARRGEGMGYYGMAMTVAMAVGPMLGVWLIQGGSYHPLFLLATGFSVAALLLALAAKTPYRPRGGRGRLQLFERSIASVMVAIFFLAAAYGGITTFVPLFAESVQVNAGTFFLVYAIALTATRPLAGKLSDRRGEAFVIVPALAVTVAALLVLSFSHGFTGMSIAAVLYGIGFGSAQPALQSAALRLAHPDRRGVANASFTASFDLGIGLGSIVLGWVSQYTGYQTLFTVTAFSAAASMAVFAIFVRRRLRAPEPATTAAATP
ncbi:MFS transporter [Cohnella nanjingensis]|uniref:MFS transporter n=1 Tax=Cohnella nanjingensis TaxID=1387779 RepID=A0A7X0VGG2_9BACL|nr:MFS transporter [Cohnella nanjingensis]MBB6671619.1 MFS transporter [Cohnella nanjingensis]